MCNLCRLEALISRISNEHWLGRLASARTVEREQKVHHQSLPGEDLYIAAPQLDVSSLVVNRGLEENYERREGL